MSTVASFPHVQLLQGVLLLYHVLFQSNLQCCHNITIKPESFKHSKINRAILIQTISEQFESDKNSRKVLNNSRNDIDLGVGRVLNASPSQNFLYFFVFCRNIAERCGQIIFLNRKKPSCLKINSQIYL